MSTQQTFAEVLEGRGVARRDFMKFCTMTAVSLGLGAEGADALAAAFDNKPRTPVIWLHGLECTCCSESFLRSSHPEAIDIMNTMISLDYDDLLMAAAGHQAEEILEDIMRNYRGAYVLAVEGNVPLVEETCIVAGRSFKKQFEEVAANAKAIIA